MTDTPTPTDEEIAALCSKARSEAIVSEETRPQDSDIECLRLCADTLEALQADLAKSRGVVMSLTQRLADAQAETARLAGHVEALRTFIRVNRDYHHATATCAVDIGPVYSKQFVADADRVLATTAPEADLNAAADSALQRMADNNDTAEEWATKLAESLPKGEV